MSDRTDTAHWTDRIVALGACSDAVRWALGYPSLAAAWAACTRGDWMLWLDGRCSGSAGDDRRRPLVLAACECARLALRFVPAGEDRPRVAIETAEAWVRGHFGVSLCDVRAAADAAYAAADAAYAAAADAAAAAYADYAYTAAYAAATYADAARSIALAECADIVRRHYPEPPEIGP